MNGVSPIAEASAVSLLDFAIAWRANWVNKCFNREKIVTSSPVRKHYNCEQNTAKQINNCQIEISEETVWLFFRMKYTTLDLLYCNVFTF